MFSWLSSDMASSWESGKRSNRPAAEYAPGAAPRWRTYVSQHLRAGTVDNPGGFGKMQQLSDEAARQGLMVFLTQPETSTGMFPV